MRINQYLAQKLGISRRAADREIEAGKVRLNKKRAVLGDQVNEGDEVVFAGAPVSNEKKATTTIMLHKPAGYITSRKHDESNVSTVMDLLPASLQHLKPVGRLDKDSSGLLLLTDDGDMLYQSTHPKFETEKEYHVEFDTPLSSAEIVAWKRGIRLTDGIAKADSIERLPKGYRIMLHQGKNRQIRRMAGKSGNKVTRLHRVRVGNIKLGILAEGKWKTLSGKAE